MVQHTQTRMGQRTLVGVVSGIAVGVAMAAGFLIVVMSAAAISDASFPLSLRGGPAAIGAALLFFGAVGLFALMGGLGWLAAWLPFPTNMVAWRDPSSALSAPGIVAIAALVLASLILGIYL